MRPESNVESAHSLAAPDADCPRRPAAAAPRAARTRSSAAPSSNGALCVVRPHEVEHGGRRPEVGMGAVAPNDGLGLTEQGVGRKHHERIRCPPALPVGRTRAGPQDPPLGTGGRSSPRWWGGDAGPGDVCHTGGKNGGHTPGGGTMMTPKSGCSNISKPDTVAFRGMPP